MTMAGVMMSTMVDVSPPPHRSVHLLLVFRRLLLSCLVVAKAASLLQQCKFQDTPDYKMLENTFRDIHMVRGCRCGREVD